jgi:hypothetical protein
LPLLILEIPPQFSQPGKIFWAKLEASDVVYVILSLNKRKGYLQVRLMPVNFRSVSAVVNIGGGELTGYGY